MFLPVFSVLLKPANRPLLLGAASIFLTSLAAAIWGGTPGVARIAPHIVYLVGFSMISLHAARSGVKVLVLFSLACLSAIIGSILAYYLGGGKEGIFFAAVSAGYYSLSTLSTVYLAWAAGRHASS